SGQSILNYEYNATIGAGRTINLENSSANLSVSRTPSTVIDDTLTIASGATVRGRGNITSGYFTSGAANTVVNNGLISADLAAATMTINPDVFTNNGTTQAINGASLTISSANWSNAAGGTIQAAGGSTIN